MRMLTATTSHEFRTPLKSIQLVLKIAYSRVRDRDEQLYLEAGLRATKILFCRANDLIDLAVLEKTGFKTSSAEFNVMDALTEIVSVMEFEC